MYDEEMTHACDVCAELDCLLSFAEASRACNYVRPQMTEENVLDIKQGRCGNIITPQPYEELTRRMHSHPLQEFVVDTFVPNDAFVVGGAGVDAEPLEYIDQDGSEDVHEERHSIVVCTGANACGKA